jgi:hypothetical protein
MATYQRRRGQPATIWKTEEQVNNRGGKVKVAVPADPHVVKAVFVPQRSARAEVQGQQHINVVRMIVDPDLEGVELWSRVEALGKVWDVVTPPAQHFGTNHVRHWSIDLRERP